MGDPTDKNQLASVINGVLSNIINTAGVDAAETAAIAAYPWLGWPIVRQIFDGILKVVAGEIYKQAAYAATKIVIDVQVELEESKTSDAFKNLQMALASGDKNAIAKASSNLDVAYGNLIHMDGWAAP